MESIGMISGIKARQEGKKVWQYICAFSGSLLSVSVGTALAWSSPVLPTLTAEDSWLPLTENEASWVSSLLAIGAVFGALPSGNLADKYGRKVMLLILAIPYLLSWALIYFACNVWMLYGARLIVGFGVGASCVLVPTYISEIAEISTKGTLGAMFQLFLTVGIVLGFVAGSMLNYWAFTVFCVILVLLYLAIFFWMPESPIYLMGKKRRPEAYIALERLRGEKYDCDSELIVLQREVESSSSKKTSVLDLTKTRASRRALIASIGGMIFQQLSGINAVIFYTVTIFDASGSSLDPSLAAILVACVQMIMSIVAAAIVDRAGRRPLLMSSSGLMCASLVALGYYFFEKEHGHDVANLSWLPLVSLLAYMIAFSIGLGPIPWMLMGELFTVELKGMASAICVTFNWLLVFFVTKTFPSMKESLGSAFTFWIFAIIMFVATVYTAIFVIETKGKSSQKIQEELSAE